MLLEKYAPETLGDIIGNNTQIKKIRSHLGKPGKPKKALMLHGPTGCGKSVTVRMVAQDSGYQTTEVNASDLDKDSVEQLVESSKQRSIFGAGKLILIDEADRAPGRLLSRIAQGAACPVVATADDPYSISRSVRGKFDLVKFSKVRWDLIANFLENVCKEEDIDYERPALEQLAKMSNGDVRAAFIDLETIGAATKERLKLLSHREQTDSVFQTLQLIFRTTSLENARIAAGKAESLEDTFRWIEENIPLEYKDPEDMAAAYEKLSRADIFRARIMRRQAWSLNKYVIDLSVLGVALSKKKPGRGFIRYKPPRFRRSFPDTTLEKIASQLHVSRKEAISYVPLLQKIGTEGFGFDDYDLKAIEPFG